MEISFLYQVKFLTFLTRVPAYILDGVPRSHKDGVSVGDSFRGRLAHVQQLNPFVEIVPSNPWRKQRVASAARRVPGLLVKVRQVPSERRSASDERGTIATSCPRAHDSGWRIRTRL